MMIKNRGERQRKILPRNFETHIRGARLRAARALADISREKLLEFGELSFSSLDAWENGRTPLTQKGAERSAYALRKVGVICSTEWLLYGIGAGPRFVTDAPLLPGGDLDENSAERIGVRPLAIQREADFFRQIHADAVVCHIMDDGMLPLYAPGDFVGGFHSTDFLAFIGKSVIAHVEGVDPIVRHLVAGKKPGTVTLTCLNENTSAHLQLLPDVRPLSVAKVVWHRKTLAQQEDKSV
jgi:transcriptional regulator with XRE-family HTH domain